MSALASDPPFFKIGRTTACFMGAGNTVVASEALMIRASRGERASMCCLTIDVGSGSSSHDFVADASTIFLSNLCRNTYVSGFFSKLFYKRIYALSLTANESRFLINKEHGPA